MTKVGLGRVVVVLAVGASMQALAAISGGSPTVATSPATSITPSAAALNGMVNPNGLATSGWFRYSSVDPGTCNDSFGTRTPTAGGITLGSGSSPVTYARSAGGLAPATTYYYCAIASNSGGTAFGAVVSFTTAGGPPTVATSAATSITPISATLNGSANPDQLSATGWFRYSTVSPGTCNDAFGTRVPASGGTALGSGSASVPYAEALAGLAQVTTYYYCALASNSSGTSFGAVVPFTTPGATPTVVTTPATSIAPSSATLNGNANPNGEPTTGWFRYDTVSPGTCNDSFGTRAPVAGGTVLGAGNSSVPYSEALAGLAQSTTYHYCAIASNPNGTSFGAVLSFTTAGGPPLVTTSAASSVTPASATLNGSADPDQLSTTGWFRYDIVSPGTCNDSFGTRVPASGGTALGAGSSPVPYSEALAGLAQFTTYYYCAIASNSSGTSFGAVLSFAVAGGAPNVTTFAASSITPASATLNGSANPDQLSTTGWFRYDTVSPGTCNDSFGTRVPASGGSALGAGSSPVPYSEALAGLAQFTTYYYCAIASNSSGTSFGAVLSFTTAGGAPNVTTSAASSIAPASATLNGSANPDQLSTTGWFRYDTVSPGTCNDSFGTRAPGSGDTALGAGNASVPYSEALAGLAPSTTYYYCAIASNSSGTSFGAVVSFTTIGGPPMVATSAASSITLSSATLNGSASPNQLSTTGWFRYDTVSPGACNDSFGTRAPVAGGTALGSGGSSVPYSQGLAGLSPFTTYYYCAIASNSSGTSFGAVLSFTTTSGPPTVVTSAATVITPASAVLNGSANPNGLATSGWFRYSTVDPGTCNDTFGTRTPTAGGITLGAGDSPVAYARSVAPLLPFTTYYYCAIASNSGGTSFGAVLSFITAGGPPTVTTSAATSVMATSATLNGSANPDQLSATGWFRYSTVSPGTCNDTFGTRAPATGGTALGAGSAPVPYAESPAGLSPSTTWYYCAIASNSSGTSFGAVLSFATTGAPPNVVTAPATSITPSSATLNGAANPNGELATGWFRYDTINPGTCNDAFGTRVPLAGGTALGSGSSSAAYSESLAGLATSTTHYYCAIASNNSGTSFGALVSFTTAGGPPLVATSAATSVTPSSARLNGSANPDQLAATGWFRYDTVSPGTCNDSFGTRVPASGGSALGSGGSSVPYAEALAGLTQFTTYYFCAIASNSAGTSFGAVVSFDTPGGPPVVVTMTATSITPTSATLNGAASPTGQPTTGWFRYSAVNPGTCNDTFGTRVPASGGTNLGSGTAAMFYAETVTDLPAIATYYYCAIASNMSGTAFGDVVPFTNSPIQFADGFEDP